MEKEKLIESFVEIRLPDADAFLKIAETLTRIGVASKKSNTLWQSCHILHKRDKYYIVHFKELFMLDGKSSNIDQSDIARRNTICQLLAEWNLLSIVKPLQVREPVAPLAFIKVLSFAEKHKWELIPKYRLGI